MNYYIYIIILLHILCVLSKKKKVYKKFQNENITNNVKPNKLEEISNYYSKLITDEIEKQTHKKIKSKKYKI